VGGIDDVEIDACDVGQIAGVLMALKQEPAAVIVAADRAARVPFQLEIDILIGLGWRRRRRTSGDPGGVARNPK
jgi:hypothetical protein